MLELNTVAKLKNASWIWSLLMGFIVSCYFFPFEFTFLPEGVNTKIMLAVLGIGLLGITCVKKRFIEVEKTVYYGVLFAVVFSVIGYIAMDVNHSKDSSYANYILSFITWLTAAYATYRILLATHGTLNFRIVINYLICVCIAQCFLALAIDMIPSLKMLVDRYISQDTVADVEFLNRVKRLYGIGAAVDVAGTRFSVVLLGLAAVLVDSAKSNAPKKVIVNYWIAFIIIVVIGNMISRTTIVGTVLALGYIGLTSGWVRQYVQKETIRIWGAFLTVTALLSLVTVYFYQTNDTIRDLLEFGFEGFFNWAKTGEWKTDSTDRLSSVMWIWPEANDTKTWLIGKATFDNWHAVGTDIGYCRFVFYNGLLGLITFSLFFVYNAWACAKKFPQYKLFFAFLLLLGFIIWMKVATDLFLVYALFYCLDNEMEETT